MKCPVCDSAETARILDSGLKKTIRTLIGNRRYVCGKCMITWREKAPHGWQRIRGRHDSGEDAGIES